MSSEARERAGETLFDHMQVSARGDIETVMANVVP